MRHDEIARRFNAAIGRAWRTVLVGGAEEPLFLPATAARPAVIRYTRDFAQSALHEVAHWCLAGPRRRTLLDYGYWYQPPPRGAAEQRRFEAAEIPVQGLECLLARLAGVRFHVSADNPGAPHEDLPGLERRVFANARRRLSGGFAPRTEAVLRSLDGDWRSRLAAFAAALDTAGVADGSDDPDEPVAATPAGRSAHPLKVSVRA